MQEAPEVAGRGRWMEEPVHGILGRDAELAQVQHFLGSGTPSALMLEGTAGIGKTTLWHAGVSFARARGYRVLSCRAAESEARLPTRRLVTSSPSSYLIYPLHSSAHWTPRSSERRSRVLHRTSERCRSRRWECYARWPQPIR
jgi:hypothetical protein